MRKIWVFVIFLILFQFSTVSVLKADTTVIKVGIYENDPLVFTGNDGKAKGLYIDILEYVAFQEKWSIEYIPDTFSKCLKKLEKGELDVMVGIAYSRQRNKLYDFTNETLLSNWAQVYNRKNMKLDSILELDGKRIAVLKGDIYYTRFKNLIDRFNITPTFVEVEHYGDVFKLVDNSNVDAGLITRLYGLRHETDYHVEKSPVICCPVELRFAVPMNKNKYIINAIDKHLISLKNDNKSIYYQSLNRWFGKKGGGILPLWSKWVMVCFGGIILLVFLMVIILKKQVSEKTKELLKSEMQYRLIAENVDDVIWLADLAFNWIYLSPSLEKLTGYTDQEGMAMPLQELITPDSYRKAMNVLKETLYEVENQHCHDITKKIEIEYNRKDGSTVWAEVNVTLKCDDEGKPISLYGVTRNISERLQIEKELRSSKEKYRELFEKGSDFLCVHDLEGKLIDTNLAFKKEYGWDKNLPDDLNIKDLMPEQYRSGFDDYLNRIKSKGHDKGTMVVISGDGRKVFLEYSSDIVNDGSGKPVGVKSSARDITHRIEAERKDKEFQEQLKQKHKMEAIGTLAGGIAHEFNNILATIIGNTEMALDDVPEWNPANECLKEIQTASLRAKDVVGQILGFARKSVFGLVPVQIRPIIKETLKLMRASIPASIEIRQDLSCEFDTIMADSTQISQVVMNLCTNAKNAMQANGGILEVNLKNITLDETSATRHEDLNPGDYIRLTVQDDGHGIDSKIMDRIFDPYFTTKNMAEGTGMGLAVVHGIVKNHSGAIIVESEPGAKGTVVEVLFPLIEAKVQPEKIDKTVGLPTGNENILFVDDEEMLVNIGQKMLTRLGYSVETKRNPIEALDLVRSHPDRFDLVITDMTMPQMRGDRLAKELINIQPDMPVILCTGYSENIDDEKARKLGIRKYIEKPIVLADLAVAVRNSLDKK